MDVDNLVEYAAASSLLSNWDGLAKNSWIIRLNSSGWRMPNCVGSSPTCAAKTWRLMPASLARTFGVMGAVDTLTDHQMIDLPLHYPVDGIGLDASMHQGQGDASPAHPLLLPHGIGAPPLRIQWELRYDWMRAWHAVATLVPCYTPLVAHQPPFRRLGWRRITGLPPPSPVCCTIRACRFRTSFAAASCSVAD